ncbi:MAG: allophanate hydrolase subunit 1 [Bacteroidia bacterium]|nr:allophanate hydrolase subunit 1 [Bacteroidia bacterium]
MQYRQVNKQSILIDWPPKIDKSIINDVLNFKNKIKEHYIEQKVYIKHAYHSILIDYHTTIDIINDEISTLKTLYSTKNSSDERQGLLWKIPVCYEEEFAPDLEAFTVEKKLSKSEIVKLHHTKIYDLYFHGFLPGFMYLGGLDPKLRLDRKSSPDFKIKSGSVAIGGEQTGIYAQDSPGGWHVIGNTPICLFDPSSDQPCFASAGDQIEFLPISKEEFYITALAVKADLYKLDSEKL